MYENLKTLQPIGVPLLQGLQKLLPLAVQEIARRHVGIPAEYLTYLEEIGTGEWKDELGFAPYYFFPRPENAAKEYFKDSLIFDDDDDNPGAKGDVWLFACNSVGTGYGFDSGDGWRLVEIDTYRSVTRLDLPFRLFVEGLLVCYPFVPVGYKEGKWFDATGDVYSKP